MSNPTPSANFSPIQHYRSMLSGAPPARAGSGTEAMEHPPLALDEKGSIEKARDELNRIASAYLKDQHGTADLIDRIIAQGDEGLRMLMHDDEKALRESSPGLEGLEAIVRTNGSRPSFLLQNNAIDFASSPVTSWKPRLEDSQENLKGLVQRVGRIKSPARTAGFAGTGFLLTNDLIMTNRHVLQVCASLQNDIWNINTGAYIDFGCEFDGIKSKNRRKLKQVVFAGDKRIQFFSPIDHTKLDLALIELEASDDFVPPDFDLSLNLNEASGSRGDVIYTIGYPGSPSAGRYEPSLLDQLFAKTYGYKRLAPGKVIDSVKSQEPWTLAHDATTLGGNSGSIIVEASQEGLAVGLHYGGRSRAPAENWSHRLSQTLDQTGHGGSMTLGEILDSYGVKVKNQPINNPQNPPVPDRQTPDTQTLDRPVQDDNHERDDVTDQRTPRMNIRSRTSPPVVTLAMMKRLSTGDILEARGDGRTSASELQDRRGYDPDFIDGVEVPLPAPSGDRRRLRRGGTGYELKYEHFSVIMSASRRLPLITACNIDGGRLRRIPRIRKWSLDGRLDDEDQWDNDLYYRNDLDRGHMVRRLDPVWGSYETAKRANFDTFHYTNSCPQMAGVNQHIWLGLEDYILNYTREDDMRVSVFTGPYFSDDDLTYRNARIPAAFWKIIAFVSDEGRFSATAYEVSQQRALSELEFNFAGYKTFQISIQKVMDSTGIDFSSLLPFDGFSQQERVHAVSVVECLESFGQIRV